MVWLQPKALVIHLQSQNMSSLGHGLVATSGLALRNPASLDVIAWAWFGCNIARGESDAAHGWVIAWAWFGCNHRRLPLARLVVRLVIAWAWFGCNFSEIAKNMEIPCKSSLGHGLVAT